MKESTRIKIWQKIVIVLIAVFIIGFFLPNVARAEDGGWGGVLLEPIKDLFVALGDGVISLMQNVVLGMDTSIVVVEKDNGGFLDFIFYACLILVGIAALALIIVSAVATAGGTLLATVGAIVSALGSWTSSWGVGLLVVGGLYAIVFQDYAKDWMGFRKSVSLPLFNLSPYEIFSDKINLLDVNFFDPKDAEVVGTQEGEYESDPAETNNFTFVFSPFGVFENSYENIIRDNTFTTDEIIKIPDYDASIYSGGYVKDTSYVNEEWGNALSPYTSEGEENSAFSSELLQFKAHNGRTIDRLNSSCENLGYQIKFYTGHSTEVDIMNPWLSYNSNSLSIAKNPDDCNFTGETTIDGDLVEGNSYTYDTSNARYVFTVNYKQAQLGNQEPINYAATLSVTKYNIMPKVIDTPAKELKSTISKWYVTLRNIAIVCLMSILLYIAIRIVLTSVASEKAKYRQMIVDWIVAMCLLFFMHYIMIFSITIVDKVIEIVDAAGTDKEMEETISAKFPNLEGAVNAIKLFQITDDELRKIAWDTLIGDTDDPSTAENIIYFYDAEGNQAESKDDVALFIWPATNYLSQARLELQTADANGENQSYSTLGWTIIYVVLIVYTVLFLFIYLKRVVYMAFLTLIAPMVALTYPIDKMNDGQAQAFNRWLKEYIFNLLIQPLHLLLYFILIGSAASFAAKNPIYVVIAMGFFIPAEKLLKSFFGFEKSQTAGGGMVATGLMMTGLNKVLHPRPPKHDSDIGRGGKGDGESTTAKKALRQKNNFDPFAVLSGGSGDDNASTPSGGITSPIGGGSIASNIKNAATSTLSSGAKRKSVPGGNTPNFTPSSTLNIGVNNPKARTPSISSAGNKSPSRFRRLRRASSATLRKFGENSITRYKSKKPLSRLARKGIRTAAGAYTGIALGSAALLGSIVTGDPSTIASATAGAAGAGYAFGRNIVSENPSNKGKEYLEAAKDAYYTEEEKQQKEEEKQIKEMRQNKQLRYAIEDSFDKKQAREMLKSGGEVEQLIRNGVYDESDILAAHELVTTGVANNIDDASAMILMSNETGDIENMGHKDLTDRRSTWEDNLSDRFDPQKKERQSRIKELSASEKNGNISAEGKQELETLNNQEKAINAQIEESRDIFERKIRAANKAQKKFGGWNSK